MNESPAQFINPGYHVCQWIRNIRWPKYIGIRVTCFTFNGSGLLGIEKWAQLLGMTIHLSRQRNISFHPTCHLVTCPSFPSVSSNLAVPPLYLLPRATSLSTSLLAPLSSYSFQRYGLIFPGRHDCSVSLVICLSLVHASLLFIGIIAAVLHKSQNIFLRHRSGIKPRFYISSYWERSLTTKGNESTFYDHLWKEIKRAI